MFRKALGVSTALMISNSHVSGQAFGRTDTIRSTHNFSYHEYHIQVPLGQTFIKNGGCTSKSTVRYHVPSDAAQPDFDLDTIGKVLIPMITMGSHGSTYQRSVATVRGATSMTVSRSSMTVSDDPARYLMEVKADPTLPAKYVMTLGYGSAWLDLGGMDVRAIDIQSGSADVFITYKSPNSHPMQSLNLNAGMAKLVVRNIELARAENIDIENSMGVTKVIVGNIPFNKSNAHINVGSGNCMFVVHQDYPIKVVLHRSMFSTVEISPDLIETGEGTYVNLAYKSNPQNAMLVVVDVSMGTFSLVTYE